MSTSPLDPWWSFVGRDLEFSNLLLVVTPSETPVRDRSQLRGDGVEKLLVSLGLIDPMVAT